MMVSMWLSMVLLPTTIARLDRSYSWIPPTGGPGDRSARFSFAVAAALGSPAVVTRFKFRVLLMVLLGITTSFAAWTWLRPYAWGVDPAARCKVVGAQIRKDQSFFWLDVHLKMLPGESHDLMKPVRLVTSRQRELEPADTTMGGTAGKGTTDLWFKFWLESADLEGPLKLRINEGSLVIKSTSGMPALGRSGSKYFPTHRW
jgi:hypothetical protein